MARQSYSEETKAAVLAALLTGQAISKVAEEYNIPEGTIKGWKSRQANGNPVVKVVEEKKERIGELLIEYIALSLETLQKQVVTFGDKKWLKEQEASQVAVLHGVIADKTIRLLEALSGPEEDE
jgi:transposase-like protein